MKNLMIVVLIFVVFALACDESGNMNEGPSGLANNGRDNSNQARRSNANVIPPTTESNDDDTGFVISQTGEEKVKPDEGRANVQGKVLYNSQPAADIEVKLCEKLNIETLACTGKSFKTRTDSSGEFLLANVPPIVYDSLLVRVFETNLYLFSTRKPGKAAKYKLEPDKTFFSLTSNLFKSDIKIQTPKSYSVVKADGFGAKWDAYPEAAYYKITLKALDPTNSSANHLDERMDTSDFTPVDTLPPGKYTFDVKAFNANDVKIAQPEKSIEFTIKNNSLDGGGKGSAAATPATPQNRD